MIIKIIAQERIPPSARKAEKTRGLGPSTVSFFGRKAKRDGGLFMSSAPPFLVYFLEEFNI